MQKFVAGPIHEILCAQGPSQQSGSLPVVFQRRRFARHLLQQDAAAQTTSAFQVNVAWHLNGPRELIFEACSERFRPDFHNALVGAFRSPGIDRHRTSSARHQVCKNLVASNVFGTRHAPEIETIRALHDQHSERTVAADLQGDDPLEFQALGNQCCRRGGMTKNLRNWLRIIMAELHPLPGTFKLHECAAHGY